MATGDSQSLLPGVSGNSGFSGPEDETRKGHSHRELAVCPDLPQPFEPPPDESPARAWNQDALGRAEYYPSTRGSS